MGDMIEITALDEGERFAAYRAVPANQTARAAIIVIQEIFGVNAGIRRKVDDWAALGYLALAPDMFWRFAPGYDVDPDVPAQKAEAFEIRKQFDPDAGVRDVEACIHAARAMLKQGKVGVVGFCLGGSVAWLAATRTDADASVGYYGSQIPQTLGEAYAIARPLMLHFGADDHSVDAATRDAIRTALAGKVAQVHDYPGAGHGFADTFGQRRNDDAAREADARTIAFFEEHLA